MFNESVWLFGVCMIHLTVKGVDKHVLLNCRTPHVLPEQAEASRQKLEFLEVRVSQSFWRSESMHQDGQKTSQSFLFAAATVAWPHHTQKQGV